MLLRKQLHNEYIDVLHQVRLVLLEEVVTIVPKKEGKSGSNETYHKTC